MSWIKKTRNWIPRLFYSWHFWSDLPFSRYWAFFGKYAQYLENSDSDPKSVTNKIDAEFNFASILFVISFYPIRRFRDIARFLENELLNISKKRSISQKRQLGSKVSWIKKDAEWYSASFLFVTLFDPNRRFRDIDHFFGKWVAEHQQKTLNISKTATRIKKVSRIEKTWYLILRLFYSWHFFDPIRRFQDIERFWENIFQNAQYLENGDSDKKE